jgi:hypothetical protein
MAKKSQKTASPSSLVVNSALKRELQDFQVKQLARNFSDLYASPQYGALCQFFVEDIYAAKDFEERNRSFENISHYFKNALGERFFHGLIRLLDLYALSDGLDDLMVQQLERLGVKKKISQESYDKAYYLCDNYERRVEQLDLIIESFDFAHHLCQHKLIGWILKTARVTAHAFGSSKESIVDVLQRGYTTLRGVPNVDAFNDIIYEREMSRLNRIYEFYASQSHSASRS